MRFSVDLKPQRNCEWETKENDLIVLLVPRFRNRLLVRYLVPRLRSSVVRIDLDQYGSFVWRHCDGEATVREIAGRLRQQFGETFDPTSERLARFIHQLFRNGFLKLQR